MKFEVEVRVKVDVKERVTPQSKVPHFTERLLGLGGWVTRKNY